MHSHMSEQTSAGQDESNEMHLPEKLKVLILDDEAEILKALTRVLRSKYDVVTFTDAHQAIEYLKENAIGLIISDMQMPEMDGAEFFKQARVLQPDAVRLLLTGHSDIEATIRAINEGGIYTYIRKPWDNDALKETIEKSAEIFTLRVERTRLTQQLAAKNSQLEASNAKLADFNHQLELKVLERTKALKQSHTKLEKILKSRNRTLQDILGMVTAIIHYRTGYSADYAERIANQSKAVALKLGLSDVEAGHVYLCALMHQIGLIGTSDDMMRHVSQMDARMPQSPNVNAVVGAEIVGHIQRFEPLMGIIRHQDELYNGTGKPDHLHQNSIPLGARIIKVVKDYDFFVASPHNPNRMTTHSAKIYIQKQAGELYDPVVVDALMVVLQKFDIHDEDLDLCLGLGEVKPGMTLKRDLYLPNGNLMLTAGNKISALLISKLKDIERQTGMPIAIHIGHPDPR